MVSAFQRALEQGCDDPLVRYCEAKLLNDLGTDPETLRDAFTGAADAMTARPYPAFRRCFAWLRSAQINLMPTPGTYGVRIDRLRAADGALDRVRQTLAEAAAEPGAMDADVYEFALMVMETFAIRAGTEDPPVNPSERSTRKAPTAPPGRQAVFDVVFPPFQRAFPKSALPLALKGEFNTSYAWEARGGGRASTVTPEGWRGFAERLATAEAALTEAWQLDPNEPTAAAPTLMITVKLGQGDAGGGRPAMEQWFDRALDANPDCLDACDAKLHYLEPKWYGSPQEMLKFGQWCADTQHHTGQIPMVYWETVEKLAELTGDRSALLSNPDIWATEQTVFERQLKLHPRDWQNRSLYVRMARDAGNWNAVRQQTQALAGFAHPKIFPDRGEYDRIVAGMADAGKDGTGGR